MPIACVHFAAPRSGLKIEEIHQVEILGGGSRIPRVQAMLQEALKGRVLDKHMDADESLHNIDWALSERCELV
eukprot:1162055-Pelagomonas_calceolata.AAC.5